ncbi:MAG TPA: nicotinate (nicotinamide) nucleotide adenylyltransferase [Candidatus Dormibacteraeota bacterium]|nr:nicotinate (nicotinamide) nucleotide adenylyltransferase [Candidatus Dormibacteraeota bacterium]
MRSELPGVVIVYGGTFDPVHNGHLAIAAQVLQQTGAISVWFMPAGLPSLHRPPAAAVADRVDMLRAALEHQHGMALRTDETERAGVSYTVDTMKALRRDHPQKAFRVLIGADAARTLPRWHRAAELLAAEQFVIVNRSGVEAMGEHELARLGFDPRAVELLRVDSPDISASEVRRRAAAGLPLNGLVPKTVAAIIAERGLYREPAARA